jgi:GNAT superfamily N-acetyltransferase
MPTIRHATPDDAALIAQHRHKMFADNQFATEDHLREMDAAFEPWVRERLVDGRYIGLLLEETGGEETSQVLAGGGILFHDFAPHWMDIHPGRGYLLNFYTAPEARGRGYANLILRAAVEECRTRDVKVASLHASRFGQPIYEKFGFEASNEMLLRLED